MLCNKPKWKWPSDFFCSKLNGLFQIEYDIDEVQLSLLQLLSSKAEQLFTYHCKKSVALPNKKGLKLMGANEYEFKSMSEEERKKESNKRRTKLPVILLDECKVRKNALLLSLLTRNELQVDVIRLLYLQWCLTARLLNIEIVLDFFVYLMPVLNDVCLLVGRRSAMA